MITQHRYRFEVDVTTVLGDSERAQAILSQFNSTQLRIAWARPAGFEIAIRDNGTLDDLGGLLTLKMEFRNATNGVIDAAGGAPILSVETGAFNPALTEDGWQNDSGNPSYHAIFEFTESQMGVLDMAAAVNNEKTFGVVITGVTAKGRIVLGAGLVTLVKDGGTNVGAGVGSVPTYTLSDAEIEAMVQSRLAKAGNADGEGFTLFDVNGSGKGIRFYVVVPPGSAQPVLKEVQVQRP